MTDDTVNFGVSPEYQDFPQNDADFALSPEHRQWISDRAIAPEVARQRGYRTVFDEAELAVLGFADYQRRVPGLLLPISDVSGKNGHYHFRPDRPRHDGRGKVVKYETPEGARLVLDVHERVQKHLRDTSRTLWITEGEGKVDAAVSQGIDCIGLSGVWGWRGTARDGTKGPLGDWESIDLTNRPVVLAFDSDVMTKPSVRMALDRLAAFLRSRKARVRFLLLPHQSDGSKMGLDDFLAAGHSRDDLERLIVDVLPVPGIAPYPVEVLPPVVRRFVHEASEVLGAPPEFVGVPLLAAASGVIGNRRYMQAKRGFTAPAVLWVATVGEPGTAKTPAASAALALVRSLQDRATDAWRRRQIAYEGDVAAMKGKPASERTLPDVPQPDPLEHFITTDATKEALAEIAEKSAGALIHRDELAAFVGSFDAYRSGRGGDRADMLSLWSGEPIKVDRKGKPSIVVRNPALSLCGSIQPDRLRVLAGEVGNDGFLDRILFAYPAERRAFWTTDEVPEATVNAMQAVFDQLRAEPDPEHPNGWPVTFSPEAMAAWRWWFDGNVETMDDHPRALRGLAAKLPLHVLRLALALHCLAHPHPTENVLDVETLDAAIALMDYHLAHAGRVMEHLSRDTSDAGRNPRMVRILRILRTEYEKDGAGWVQHGVLLRALGNIPTKDLRRELEALVDEGIVERNEIISPTRKGDEWRLTPLAPPSEESPPSYDSNHSKDSGISASSPTDSPVSPHSYDSNHSKDSLPEQVARAESHQPVTGTLPAPEPPAARTASEPERPDLCESCRDFGQCRAKVNYRPCKLDRP